MDGSIARQFSPYLASGEAVRWTGQPQQGIVFRTLDLFLIPFTLVWLGFAVFWEYSVWVQQQEFGFMMLWGAMFICLGLYFVVGRFLVDAFARSKQYYALTDERALILGGLTGGKLVSIDLRSNAEVRYDVRGSHGTIGFGPHTDWFRRGTFWHPSAHGEPEFFRTSDAAAAYKFIQARRRAA